MEKPVLPQSIVHALKQLPKTQAGIVREFLEVHLAFGHSLRRALQTGGGASIQRTLEHLQQPLLEMGKDQTSTQQWPAPFIHRLHKEYGLKFNDISPMMDGWNLLLLRQRYRDTRQRDTVITQIFSHPLYLLHQLLTKTKPDTQLKQHYSKMANGFALGEMIRTFWLQVNEGRILISETELEERQLSAQLFAEKSTSPKLISLLQQYREQAEKLMDEGAAKLQPENPLRPFVLYLCAYEKACLARCAKLEYSRDFPVVELPFMQRFFLRTPA